MLTGLLPNPVVAGEKTATETDENGGSRSMAVKVVRPKRDANFRVSNQQLATVEPFYEAELRARASGVVRFVAKDIGEPVRTGELLVEIDAPDLDQAVAQKEAVVRQREQEVTGAEADLANAKAAVVLAKASVKQKEAELLEAQHVKAARMTKRDRVKKLVASGTVTPDAGDEAELDYQAAVAGVASANAAVEKAKAEQTQKEAGLQKAVADLDIKRALVNVANKDRDVAAAQAAYARVYAPFDGVITRRTVDPGRFVQGSAAAGTEPLITLARVDLVTVVMRLPDTAAPFLGPHTEAVIEFDQLPGVVVRGPITRFSPAINTTDRTARVEVDVFNGTRAGYERLLSQAAAQTTFAPMVPADPLAALMTAGNGQIRTASLRKGARLDGALIPDWGDRPRARQIAPGTTGTIRVFLDEFAEAYLLPSGAVFNRGGQSCIMVVENGVTRTIPVAVQVNDGRLAKVAVVDIVGGRKVTRELTGNEVVVAARQVEIGDGQQVQPVFEAW
jgi:multidrug resistance efflux pump